MCNKTKFIVLAGCLFVVNSTYSILRVDFDDLHKNANRLFAETRAHFDQVICSLEQDFKRNIDCFSTNLALEVLEEPDNLKVILALPKKTSWNKQDNKIDLEAKGLFLEGSLEYEQYKIKLLITDGRVLRVSYQAQVSNEATDQDSKASRQAVSMSSQSMILPERVNQLENTHAQITDDGKLILLLPKQTVRNQGWHKIKVK